MNIVDFTPASGFIGGLFIGIASSLLLWMNGRIAGISGIFNGAMARSSGDATWRWLFIAGLLGGAAIEFWLVPGQRAFASSLSWPVFLIAGVLVGFGTRLGSGCTSGHGVCGLGRLSARSLAATLTFLVTGAATVFIVWQLLGVHP